VTALASFESTVVSTAMPTIIGDLNGLPLYSWVFSVYLLAATVTMPLYGRLADIYGRRRVLLIAIVLFVAGATVCAAARSMPQLIVARGFQGLGAGGLVPIAITVSGDLYSLPERARVQGLFSSVWGLASLVGPMAGAALTLAFGWRSIFFLNLPLGFLALALVATQMKESREPLSERLDVAGALTLTLGVTSLLLATLRKAGSGGAGTALRISLLVLGALLLGVFAWLQTRRAHPLIPPVLFTRAATAAPYLSGVLIGTTIYGVDTFVPLFVQGARGGTAAAAGAVVTPLVLGWAFSAAVAARAIVRHGFRKIAFLGALLILIGFAGLLAGATHDAGVVFVSVACAFVGCGLGPAAIAQTLAIQEAAEERDRGVATSLVPFFRTVGGALGVGALGGILAHGLTARLGASADVAGAHLTGSGAAPELASAVRLAIESSLVPVFWILLALGVANVVVIRWFPGKAEPAG